MRILVYQRHGQAWVNALEKYKQQGYQLGRSVQTRRERCYKGPERCDRIWTLSKKIEDDYAAIGIPNDLG